MPNPAGYYSDRMRRLVRSTTKDDNNGQDVESWTEGDYLWCHIEQTTGQRPTDYGATETGQDAEISIRNYVTILPQDRLYSVEWDETYIVDTIRRGDNEIVCECHRYDLLEV